MTQVIRAVSIRNAIQSLLESVHPHLYYEHAPKDASYPHLVYTLDDSLDNGLVENFSMEIDGWDKSSDTLNLETLMGKVDNALHRSIVVQDGLSLRFYRENRRSIRDPDKRLRRRQLVFQIKVMGGNR